MGYEERNHAFKIVRQSLGFPSSSVVKNPPAMRETWVRSLGWEDPPEKEKATHSSILVWRIPCRKESDMTEKLSLALVALVVKNLSANAGDARDTD